MRDSNYFDELLDRTEDGKELGKYGVLEQSPKKDRGLVHSKTAKGIPSGGREQAT